MCDPEVPPADAAKIVSGGYFFASAALTRQICSHTGCNKRDKQHQICNRKLYRPGPDFRNFIFDWFLGLPRYRYVIPRGYDFHVPTNGAKAELPVADEQLSPKLPGFMERVPVILTLDEVLAIKAEQHYTRVYTPEREYMLLYRFSDAVRELGPDIGIQVHRSYWVNKKAIDCVKPRTKKFLIKLVTGTEIPVSTPYHAMVKDLTRALGLSVRA